MLQTFCTDDITHTDQVHVVCWHLDGQVTLGDPELEVHLFLAANGAGLHFFNRRRTVVWVYDRLADLKIHVMIPLSRPQVYHASQSAPRVAPGRLRRHHIGFAAI
ncbi:hypothetical protein GCM10009673_23350 [Nesterenkonia sandarakina]